jgi:transposase
LPHGFTEVAATLDVEELAGRYGVDVDTIECWLRQLDEQTVEELRKQ